MPCYLFTYHAYGSWMPDRPQGYVQRGEGVLPADNQMARMYRRRAAEEFVTLRDEAQKLAIDESLIAGEKQGYRLHFVATDSSHVHVLISWKTDRSWEQARNAVKQSLTRRLNAELGRRTWFSENASRKRVKDSQHFDYLVTQYLPSHHGWKWRDGTGLFRDSVSAEK